MELSIARSTKRPPHPKAVKPKAAKPIDVDGLLKLVETSLDDDQAEGINTLTLRGKSSMADYMVIATGRNPRQIAAMADHLATKLKAAGAGTVHVEGLRTCEWVLIDCGDIIVHLFRPEIRSFYNLEKMWGVDMPGDLPGDRPTTSRVRA